MEWRQSSASYKSFCIDGKMLKSNFNFGNINSNSEKMEESWKPIIKKFKGRCCLAVEKMWETLMRHISGQVFIFFPLYVLLFSMFKNKWQGMQERSRNLTYRYDSWASTRTSHCPLQRLLPTAPINSSCPETQGYGYQFHWPHPRIPSANLSSTDCRWEVSRVRPISKLPHHPHPSKIGRKHPHRSSSISKNRSSLNYHWLYKCQQWPLQPETKNPPARPTKTHKNPEIFPQKSEKEAQSFEPWSPKKLKIRYESPSPLFSA